MIALMFAAQIAAAPLPTALPLDQVPSARTATKGVLIQRRAPPGSCIGNIGQMEAAYARPTALYRQGDRPAKGLRSWADYPEGTLCLIEASR